MTLDTNTENKLISQIFNNTVATYKYYWFISILDIVVKENKRQISFWEIIAHMVSEAWYPIHYFRISFGKSDSLYTQIVELQLALNIPIDATKSKVKQEILHNIDNPKIKNLLRVFSLNVPYRFLSPWITYSTDNEVSKLSQTFANNCLYAIQGDQIIFNTSWENYFHSNYLVLRDFTFWNLTTFLQKRNPNVPDLPSKLVKPITRESLIKQRNLWDTLIDLQGPIQCIYTGKTLDKKDYDLDHFIPWSFVSHNLLWNLLPIDASINSSKSNNLPNLDEYLHPFAVVHQELVKTIYHHTPNNKLLEDYLTLHDSISELAILPNDKFETIFRKTFSPLAQIAENMGFSNWQYSNIQ